MRESKALMGAALMFAAMLAGCSPKAASQDPQAFLRDREVCLAEQASAQGYVACLKGRGYDVSPLR